MTDGKDNREELLRLREENLRLREERLASQNPPGAPPPTTIHVTQKNEGCLAGCGSLILGALAILFLVSQCSGH
jgi:hypothetical protein